MFTTRRRASRALLSLAAISLSATAAVALPTVASAEVVPVQAPAVPQAQAVEPFDVLVFSKTAGFRHDAIPAGIAAIQQLGAANDFTVDATEDGGAFTDANLAKYEVVVFLSTTGDVLNADQQAAFERYIKAGGGFAGIHAASDTDTTGRGTASSSAPTSTATRRSQQATVKVEDPAHPSTDGPAGPLEPRRRVVQLPRQPARQRSTSWPPWTRPATRRDRRDGRRPPDLLVPRTTTADAPGTPALGHTQESYAEPHFLRAPARRHRDGRGCASRPTAARR